jgi:hypothetical protein
VICRSEQVIAGVKSGKATVRQIDKPLAGSIVVCKWRHEAPPSGLSLGWKHLATCANEASLIKRKTRLFGSLCLVSWLSHHAGNKPNAGTQLLELCKCGRDIRGEPLGRYEGASLGKGRGPERPGQPEEAAW